MMGVASSRFRQVRRLSILTRFGMRGLARQSVWLFLASWLVFPQLAFAHKPSDSYLKIQSGSSGLTADWDISLKDLELLLGLDHDQNGSITWGEVKARRDAIESYALSHLAIAADGEPCELRVTDFMVTTHSDGAYCVLRLAAPLPQPVDLISIRYSLLFHLDPTHRGLVVFNDGQLSTTRVLSPTDAVWELRAQDRSVLSAFLTYVREGVWHIWIGFDHILFLMALLFPAVLERREGAWKSVAEFRPACSAVLKIVTMFTVAHSITLWLATMEYVQLPSHLVEATIALSIVVTALHNIFPVWNVSNAAIAFGFGLIHGLGFANVLQDLGLGGSTLAVSLLGFNLGVELGQMAIVAVFLPVAFMLRSTTFYRQVILHAGSACVMLLAAVWTVERLCNLEILSRFI